MIDYGGYSVLACLGTLFLTTAFGVPADEALATQLLLLGFAEKKQIASGTALRGAAVHPGSRPASQSPDTSGHPVAVRATDL